MMAWWNYYSSFFSAP